MRTFVLSILALSLFLQQAADAQEQPPYGAAVPFISHEAEEQTTTGEVVRLGPPPHNAMTPVMEASARSFVELDATGEYVELTASRDANFIVLRNCVPDAPAGGGAQFTLSLYVNGQKRQAVTLSSKHTWLYGGQNNGQSNNPADGAAHVYWDDAFHFLDTPVKAGDGVRLQKDAGDDAAFYRLDLIDLEMVAPPLAQPENSLSVLDYGATANDDTDDTDAIAKCILDAKAQGKAVWLPAGTYRQSVKFQLHGQAVHGAGMWHTTIIGTAPGEDFAGKLGFVLNGDGDAVTDLNVRSDVDTSRSRVSNKAFTGSYGNTKNFRVENVAIVHANVGMWLSGCDDGVVRNCRVHLTYADGINLNRGSSRNLVENNYVRGIGDDGVVILGGTENTINGVKVVNVVPADNTLRRNTVTCTWWGRNANVDAGSGHVVEYNLFIDNSHGPALGANNTTAYPAYPITSTTIRHNKIVRGGGRGSLWINTDGATYDDFVVHDNLILDSMSAGVSLTGRLAQHVRLENNVIERPARDAIVIANRVTGSGTLVNNTVRGLPDGAVAVRNNAGEGYALHETGTKVE